MGPPGPPLPALDHLPPALPWEAQPGKEGRPSQTGEANVGPGQLKAPSYERFMQPEGRRPAEDSLLGLWGCSNGSSSCSPSLSPNRSFVLQTNGPAVPGSQPHTHTHPNTHSKDTCRGRSLGGEEGTQTQTLRQEYRQRHRYLDTGTYASKPTEIHNIHLCKGLLICAPGDSLASS